MAGPVLCFRADETRQPRARQMGKWIKSEGRRLATHTVVRTSSLSNSRKVTSAVSSLPTAAFLIKRSEFLDP